MKVIHALAVSVLALSLIACDKKEAVQQANNSIAQQPKTVMHDAGAQSSQAQVSKTKRHVYTEKELEETAYELRKAGGLSEREIQKAVNELRN